MESQITPHTVNIVRLAGNDPVTGTFVPYGEEEIIVYAVDEQSAYIQSQRLCKMRFSGQERKTYINGREYFNPKL